MIYIFESINNTASIVLEENTLTEEEKARGIALEKLPLKEEYEGKIAILKADKSKEKVWYEYIENVKAEEGNEKETFAKTLAQLTIDNKQKDVVIKNLSQTVAELTIKVNKLKGDVK